jgi:hypothetical protein
LTQLGFVRLATNPRVFAEEALTLPDAWGCFDRFLEDTRIEFGLESLGKTFRNVIFVEFGNATRSSVYEKSYKNRLTVEKNCVCISRWL